MNPKNDSETLTRREFLKASGATGATLALGPIFSFWSLTGKAQAEGLPPPLDGYDTTDELHERLRALPALAPEGWVKVTEMEEASYQKRSIIGVEISNPYKTAAKAIIGLSGLHTREPYAPMALTNNLVSIVTDLNSGYSERVRCLLDGTVKLVSIPLANPDGRAQVVEEYQLHRRKNMNFSFSPSYTSCAENPYHQAGVDLNRAFPGDIQVNDPLRRDPCEQTFRGNANEQLEPEIKAVTEYFTDRVFGIANIACVLFVDFHQHGGYVLPGTRLHPDVALENNNLCRVIARDAFITDRRCDVLGKVFDSATIDGSAAQWAQNHNWWNPNQKVLSMIVELGYTGFYPPESDFPNIDRQVERTLGALLYKANL